LIQVKPTVSRIIVSGSLAICLFSLKFIARRNFIVSMVTPSKACSPLSSEARRTDRFAVPTYSERCASLSDWAAIVAVMTEVTRAYSLAIPLTLPVIVLLLCNQNLIADRK
jgi:hypothetical protein